MTTMNSHRPRLVLTIVIASPVLGVGQHRYLSQPPRCQ